MRCKDNLLILHIGSTFYTYFVRLKGPALWNVMVLFISETQTN